MQYSTGVRDKGTVFTFQYIIFNDSCSVFNIQYSIPGIRRYFQHAHFIPIVGVGKRVEYYLVHDDLPRQPSFGTTLRFTGPVPAYSRQ